MEPPKSTVSRPLVGFLTIGLFAVSLAFSLWPNPPFGAAGGMVAGATSRVGIVLAAYWLALPTRSRAAAWANVSIPSAFPLLLAAMALLRIPFRILIPLAAFVLVVGLFLRPRPAKRPERRFGE
jgi:hypothetical protein